jgi:hypothetical protein
MQNVDDDGNPVTDFKAVAKNPTFVQHEKTQQKIVAFLMGLVPRLGRENSLVFAFLDSDTGRSVVFVSYILFGIMILALTKIQQ